MKYLNKQDILSLGINWREILGELVKATELIHTDKVAQPLKPYLRFNDPANRIIAMPAYVGGGVGAAGIKWIASFPDNLDKGLARAHSVMILNDQDTGEPTSIINTAYTSGIRTAAVTGVVIDKYLEQNHDGTSPMNWGIIGFGPIGQLHLEMIASLYSSLIDKVYIYDLRGVDISAIPEAIRDKVEVTRDWVTAFKHAQVFMTCTASKEPYIHEFAEKGTLQLNVSLRDYTDGFRDCVDVMIVDNWEEVCRENTDIERMHLNKGLIKEEVLDIYDAVCGSGLADCKDKVVMFNPMGMAIYDIATANYYHQQSVKNKVGLDLEC